MKPDWYFTADTHFGCVNLVEQTRKEFSTVEEHDETILDGINSTVGRHDHLVIAGDFCLRKPGHYRPKIKCRHIFFCMGNHDKRAQTEAVFGRVWDHYMVKTGGKLLWAFHYPTAYWPQSHYGAFHCFGHIHDNLEHEAAMDLAFPARRSMDVGVDAAKRRLGDYRPFATEEVLGFLDGRPGHGLRERGAHSDVI